MAYLDKLFSPSSDSENEDPSKAPKAPDGATPIEQGKEKSKVTEVKEGRGKEETKDAEVKEVAKARPSSVGRLLSTIAGGIGSVGQTIGGYFSRNKTPPSTNKRPLPIDQERCEANWKLYNNSAKYLARRELKISVCTWNVATRQPPANLAGWLGVNINSPDIVVVGLQEAELGGTAFILETTETSVTWSEAICDTLNNNTAGLFYKKIQTIQLVGIVLIIVAQAIHSPFIHHVKISLVRTGISGVVGNKGSVGIRATIYGKRFLFICAHFAAHKGNLETRNANYYNSLSELKFSLPIDADDEMDIVLGAIQAQNAIRASHRSAIGASARDRFFKRKSKGEVALDNQELLFNSHDYVFFFGDLNYRLLGVLSPAAIRADIEAKNFDNLLGHDELIGSKSNDEAFAQFREPPIHFAPTYKFQAGTLQYDSKRDPAWTDRVLYRILHKKIQRSLTAPAKDLSQLVYDEEELTAGSPSPRNDGERRSFIPSSLRVLAYHSEPISSSDHLPVSAQFAVDVVDVNVEVASKLLQELGSPALLATKGSEFDLNEESFSEW